MTLEDEANYEVVEYGWNNRRDIDILVGQTITAVHESSDEIIFETSLGYKYRMYHEQDCCEHVYIESTVGDIQDLVGQTVRVAEERNNVDLPALSEWEESYTWTFYTIRTVKCSIDIRWYGSSNGYYGESASFARFA